MQFRESKSDHEQKNMKTKAYPFPSSLQMQLLSKEKKKKAQVNDYGKLSWVEHLDDGFESLVCKLGHENRNKLEIECYEGAWEGVHGSDNGKNVIRMRRPFWFTGNTSVSIPKNSLEWVRNKKLRLSLLQK